MKNITNGLIASNIIFCFLLSLVFTLLQQLDSSATATYAVFALTAQAATFTLIFGLFFHPLNLLWSGRTASIFQVLIFALIPFFFLVDFRVYNLLSLHINALVLNVLFSAAGRKTLGLHSADIAMIIGPYLLIIACFIALLPRIKRGGARIHGVGLFAAIILFVFADKAIYAMADLFDKPTLTSISALVPLHQPTTIRKFANRYMDISSRPVLNHISSHHSLAYPKESLHVINKGEEKFNVLLVAIDSWRADALSAEDSPNIWNFAQTAQIYENHFSGGNATRPGLFSLFYGVYAANWQNFLSARRGPVLLDQLAADGYQFSFHSSTSLSFPEFRQTIFTNFNAEIHDDYGGPSSLENDRLLTDDFKKMISTRSLQSPFFAFLFYDSAHGPYWAPDEFKKYAPYSSDVVYSLLTKEDKKTLLYNRYRNAVLYVDSLLNEVFATLEQAGLSDNTIVIVTGDHGEEFLDYGNFGHSGDLNEAQVKVPMIIRWPGKAPGRVSYVTSHHDIVPTLMHWRGVVSPEAYYSNGKDLFGDRQNAKAYVTCGWDTCAFVSDDLHYIFGSQPYNAYKSEFRDRYNKVMEAAAGYQVINTDQILDIIMTMSRFQR